MRAAAAVAVALAVTYFTGPVTAEPLPTFDDARRAAPVAPPRLPHCSRRGTLLVSVGSHVFKVPRNILSQAGNDASSVSIPCGAARVTGRFFSLSVNRSFAGDAFYEDWIRAVRAPTSMLISAGGYIRNTTADQFADTKQRGWPVTQAPGIESVATHSTIYYRLDRPDVPLFISCSTIVLLHGGHDCTTAYRLGDLDIRYHFSDAHVPQAEWLEMDIRFRRFLRKLEDDAAVESR